MQKKIAFELFKMCKECVSLLDDNYKPISDKGRFEAIIFNSLIALDKIHSKYQKDYESISNYFFLLLLSEAKLISITLDSDTLFDLINSRYVFFDKELRQLYTNKMSIPGGTFHVFYEEPIDQNPENSFDLLEIVLFKNALVTMINSITLQSDTL